MRHWIRRCLDLVASPLGASRARLQPNEHVRSVRKGERAECERVPAGGLGNLLWCHRNRYTDGVDGVCWRADLTDQTAAAKGKSRQSWSEHQLGMPPSISQSSVFELLIESDSDGIYF